MTGRTALTRCVKVTAKLLFGAALLAAVAPMRADAISQVTLNGSTYDLTEFTGFTGNESRFSTAFMPWHGNSGLAQQFSIAAANQIGGNYSNLFLQKPSVNASFGAVYFATAYNQDFGLIQGDYLTAAAATSPFLTLANQTGVYAYATCVSGRCNERVPAPLPILGASAAFVFSRRLRRRIGNRVSA